MNTFLTRDGRSFIIRRPIERDAENIINYSKILFASTDQLLTTLEEYAITIENEETWINNFTETPDALCLVAELNDQLVGLLFFMPLTKKKNTHVGEFGVNVHPDLQGNGIGRVLVVELLKWAKENKRIEKIFLNVFATNQKAIELYKKLGFVEEGRFVKAIKQPTGEYVDVIQMYVEVK